MTPLIDVVLVVLIIFMIATPIVIRDMTATVPNMTPAPVTSGPLVVRYHGGVISVNQQIMTEGELADDEASYATAVRLMDLVRSAGAKTLALETTE